MANKIVFNYVEMTNAVNSINALAEKYIQASDAFQIAIKTATDPWEGASKDKFMEFINGAVKNHMGTNVPEMVKGVATLLDNNATAMKNADTQVGDKMPDKL